MLETITRIDHLRIPTSATPFSVRDNLR